MGCEAPKDDIEQIVCEIRNNEQQALIDAAVLDTQTSLQAERLNIGEMTEASASNIEKVQETMSYVGNEERLFFIDFFDAPADPDGFVARVKEIQANLYFAENDRDGVIGPYTLSQIYTRYYIQQYDTLPQAQRTRIDIYAQMQNYPPRNVYNAQGDFIRTIEVNTKPDAFNDLRYWGGSGFSDDTDQYPVSNYRPRAGTMFAQGILESGFDENQYREPNSLYIERFDGKHILTMYDQNGQCILATYTSPGSDSANTNGVYNKRSENNLNMHYISNDTTGAPMPYGINISDWNFLIHSGAGMVTGNNASNGCFRLALGYANEVFKQVQNMGEFTLHVNI